MPPIPIENAVKREIPLISNAMLIGDQKKFLSMLLTIKVGAAKMHKSQHTVKWLGLVHYQYSHRPAYVTKQQYTALEAGHQKLFSLPNGMSAASAVALLFPGYEKEQGNGAEETL